MTIEEYNMIFGFKISLVDYRNLMGFIPANITPDLRQECADETGDNDDESVINYMMARDTGNIYLSPYVKNFVIDGIVFTIRGFTHDKEDHDTHVIVGVDTGKLEVFSGDIHNYGRNPKKDITVLLQQESWREIIRHSEGDNAWSGGRDKNNEYKLHGTRYDTLYITPMTYLMGNDCGCCS